MRRANFDIELVRDRVALEQHLPALYDLSQNAAEANPSYEPWSIAAAMSQFGSDDPDIFLLLIFSTELPCGTRKLYGLFPLRRRKLNPLRAATAVELWRFKDSVLCTPVVRKGHVQTVIEVFFNWVKSHPSGGTIVHLGHVRGDGAFAEALADVTFRKKLPIHLSNNYCRALAVLRNSSEEYLHEAFRGRHLKEFRRKERALAQLGILEFRIMHSEDEVDYWINAFIELEKRGWKGRNGLAVACDAPTEAQFREIVHSAWSVNRLMFAGLFLDGHPIALKCNLLSQSTCFAWKIAFDEDFAKYSPGMLLEIYNIRLLHERQGIAELDFCTWSGHELSNRIGLDRQLISNLYVSSGRPSGDLLVALLGLARWLKWAMKPAARSATPTHPEARTPAIPSSGIIKAHDGSPTYLITTTGRQ